MKFANKITPKGFIENSFVDWPGRIASVVFLPGCSFDCGWCHNRKLIESPDELPDLSLQNVIQRITELREWVDGIVITGGEPTVHKNLPDFIKTLKQVKPVKLDTNGSNPRMLDNLLQDNLIEGISMDVKAPLNKEKYSRVAGTDIQLENIIQSIQIIMNSNIWYEFRTTLVPGLHTREDVLKMRDSLDELSKGNLQRPLKLQAFKPAEHLPEPWCSLPAFDLDTIQK